MQYGSASLVIMLLVVCEINLFKREHLVISWCIVIHGDLAVPQIILLIVWGWCQVAM